MLSFASPRSIGVLAAMLLATLLAAFLTPRVKISDLGPRVDLEAMVPKQFGEWKVDETIVPILPSPDQQALLNRLYNQTLARTYVSKSGNRVMLSIAYGGDQSDAMQVHRPEVCYAAQGFQILREVRGYLSTGFGDVPVKRLLAKQGARVEPITYWITIGGRSTYAGVRQKLVQLGYGLTGKVPDGMLVRVSSIGADEDKAYRMQEAFVYGLVQSLQTSDRSRFVGHQLK